MVIFLYSLIYISVRRVLTSEAKYFSGDLLADSQKLVSAILRSALYQCVLLGKSLTLTTLLSLFAKLGNNSTFVFLQTSLKSMPQKVLKSV